MSSLVRHTMCPSIKRHRWGGLPAVVGSLLVLSIAGCPSDPAPLPGDVQAEVTSDTFEPELPPVDTTLPDDADTAQDVSLADTENGDIAPDVIEDIEAVDTTPPPPVFGNNCDLPIEIGATVLPFTQPADTAQATSEYSLGGGCQTGGDIGAGIPELVYRFTPDISGHHIIGLSPSTFTGANPTVIYITTDCADMAGTCVAVSPDLSTGGIFSAYLEAGVAYWIVADGLLPSDVGPYTLIVDQAVCVPLCPQPGTECGKDGCGGLCGAGCGSDTACEPTGFCVAKDTLEGNTCSNPFEVDTIPFSASADTYYASDFYAHAASACQGETQTSGSGARDHVYRFTPDTTGKYAINLTSDYDASLYIAEDCDNINGTCIAGDDSSLVEEGIETVLEAGKTYFIFVDGFDDDNDNGIYSLTISSPCIANCDNKNCGNDGCGGSCGSCDAGDACNAEGTCAPAPEGDHCLNPFVVDDVPFTHSADTSEFNTDYFYEKGDCSGVEYGWGKGANDTIYMFKAPKSDLYKLSIEGSFDTTIYVVKDCTDIGGTCLSAADEAISGEELEIWFEAEATYYIIVDGSGNLSSPAGPYTLTINFQCVPQCENKVCGDDGCGDVCGECAKGTICNDFGQCEGTPGDTCAYPFNVPSAPITLDGDSSDASDIYAVPYDACPGETGIVGKQSKDEVWSFTPTESGVYTLTVEADFTASVYVLNDCNLFVEDCFIEKDPGLAVWWDVEKQCKDTEDACLSIGSGFTLDSSTATQSVWLDADTTVYIVVDGNSFSQDFSGPYTLSISEACTPQCDGKVCGPDGCGLTCGECELGLLCAEGQCETLDGNTCETAFPIDAIPFEASGKTFNATNVYGLPKESCPDQEDKVGAGSRDVVYTFTPDETALYEIDADLGFNGVIYVMTDCSTHLSTCFYKETLGYYSWAANVGSCMFGSEVCLGLGEPDEEDEEEKLKLKVPMEAGVPHYIIIDGKGMLADYAGSYSFSFDKACVPQCENKECGDDGCGEVCGSCPAGFTCSETFTCVDNTNQDGNTCGTAWNINTVPFIGSGDTTDDSDIYNPGECGKGMPGSKDEVWAFTPEKTGVYVITVKPDFPFETVYSIVKSCVDLSFECVKSTAAETISPTLEAGVTYFIIVDSDEDGPQEGTYVLTITEPE